jgi:hypothetical protein
MRHARRQIQDIALGCIVILIGAKLLQQRQLSACERIVRDIIRRKFPVTNAGSLTQENVVIVAVRSNTAARGSETHHEIINAPVRDEIHVIKQGAHLGQVFFEVMNQQGPVALWQTFKILRLKRSGFSAVARGVAVPFDEYFCQCRSKKVSAVRFPGSFSKTMQA